jgi:hypothetical protein
MLVVPKLRLGSFACGDRDNAQPLSRFVRFGKLLRRDAVDCVPAVSQGKFHAHPHHSSDQSEDGFADDAPDLPELGAVLSARRSPRRLRIHSTRPIRSGVTDENIEPIDFDLKADLVGISAMTSYVNRGYEIADQFRAKGMLVVMGDVHPGVRLRKRHQKAG